MALMAQLLVRNVADGLVRKLKRRACDQGVSAEEEHRQILAESLTRDDLKRPSLLHFLLSRQGTVAPDVQLDLARSREKEAGETGWSRPWPRRTGVDQSLYRFALSPKKE